MSALKDFFNVCLILCRSKVCDARIESLPRVPAAQFLFRNSRTDFKCSHSSGFASQIGNAAECSIHTDTKITHRFSSKYGDIGMHIFLTVSCYTYLQPVTGFFIEQFFLH